MGQAALSELVTQCVERGVGLQCCAAELVSIYLVEIMRVIVQPLRAKGNRVNIHDPAHGDVSFLHGREINAATRTNSETTAEVPGRVLFSL